MTQEVFLNQYTLQNPLPAKMVENRPITPASRGVKNDVRHIVFRYGGKLSYLPGQSVGILPPGSDPATGKPHKLRLYSVASEGRGDCGDAQTVSLCVVRHFWDNPAGGRRDIPGVASNYLCDLKPGDEVRMTGPVGRHFLLPEDFLTRDFIFLATGTGIAPYRGMLKEMLDASYKGRAWLFFGAKYGDTLLYDQEFEAYRRFKNFSYVRAVSREDKNPVPEIIPTLENRMYVQVQLYVQRDSLKQVLADGRSYVYLCGLKGMEQGIFPVLERLGAEMGATGSLVARLKAERRLKIEVY